MKLLNQVASRLTPSNIYGTPIQELSDHSNDEVAGKPMEHDRHSMLT